MKNKSMELTLFISVILISIFGVIMIYSSSYVWAEYKYNDPYKYLKNSDLFILSSRYEAFGLVVIEALTLEVPVLATENHATNKIIKHKEIGYITENSSEGIYNGLKYILENLSDILGKVDTFEIEIIQINILKTNGYECMLIQINDKRLIDNFGGFVRGMSGSPIIQNNINNLFIYDLYFCFLMIL